MEYSFNVEESGEIKRKISFNFPKSLIENKFTELLNTASKTVSLKGFRPGKAPKDMIKKIYGSKIHSDVLQDLLNDAYKSAVSKHSLEVVGQPVFDLPEVKENEDYSCTAEIHLYPRPTITNVFDLAVEVEQDEYTPKHLEKALSNIQDRLSSKEEVTDRDTVKTGDFVSLKVISLKCPEIDETDDSFGLKGNHLSIDVGQNKFSKVFEEKVLGMKLGETKEIEFVPTANQNILNVFVDKTVTISVELEKIFSKTLPTTEELAQKAEKNVEEYLKFVEEELKKSIEAFNKQEVEVVVFDKIIENNPFEVPDIFVDNEIRNILFERKVLDPNDKNNWKIEVDFLRNQQIGESAKKRVIRSIIIERVLDENAPEFDESSFEQWLKEEYQKYGLSLTEGDFQARFQETDQETLANLRDNFRRKLLIDKITGSAKVKAIPLKDPAVVS